MARARLNTLSVEEVCEFMWDLFDEFFDFDVSMGADVVKCPHCGSEVSCSLLLDDEVECPDCGKTIRRN